MVSGVGTQVRQALDGLSTLPGAAVTSGLLFTPTQSHCQVTLGTLPAVSGSEGRTEVRDGGEEGKPEEPVGSREGPAGRRPFQQAWLAGAGPCGLLQALG